MLKNNRPLAHLTPIATSLKLIAWGMCIKNLDFAASSSSGSGQRKSLGQSNKEKQAGNA
jgi:hypothetical protein